MWQAIGQMVGGIANMDLSMRGSKQQQAELKHQAYQSVLEGNDRVIARKEEMLDELARRNATFGAGTGTQASQDRAFQDGQEDLTAISAFNAASLEAIRRARAGLKSSQLASMAGGAGQTLGGASSLFNFPSGATTTKSPASSAPSRTKIGGGFGGGMFNGSIARSSRVGS